MKSTATKRTAKQGWTANVGKVYAAVEGTSQARWQVRVRFNNKRQSDLERLFVSDSEAKRYAAKLVADKSAEEKALNLTCVPNIFALVTHIDGKQIR